jgi:hypothetical protein
MTQGLLSSSAQQVLGVPTPYIYPGEDGNPMLDIIPHPYMTSRNLNTAPFQLLARKPNKRTQPAASLLKLMYLLLWSSMYASQLIKPLLNPESREQPSDLNWIISSIQVELYGSGARIEVGDGI